MHSPAAAHPAWPRPGSSYMEPSAGRVGAGLCVRPQPSPGVVTSTMTDQRMSDTSPQTPPSPSPWPAPGRPPLPGVQPWEQLVLAASTLRTKVLCLQNLLVLSWSPS